MEVVGAARSLFIPPKKRQSGRKTGGILSHGDHIMTVQGKNNMETVSAHTPDIEACNTASKYSSIANRPKLELPIDSETYTNDETKPLNNLSTYHSREIVDLSPILENISESTEIIKMTNSRSQSGEELLDACSFSNTQSNNSLETVCVQNSSQRKSKKRVNIQTESDFTESSERISLKPDSETSGSLERSLSCSTDGYLTMTGTIKRGKKKGQSIDVQLNISAEQLEMLETEMAAKELNKSKINICVCNSRAGLHIFFWSLFCLPFITIISSVYSFYMGTLTWYNVFTYFSEEKTYLHRLLVTPILVILYPFIIILCTLGLGIYAGFVQLSICGTNWWKEVADIEKGFYGWLCSFLKISDCSPYEVVILTDLRKAHVSVRPSVEELSM